MEFTQTLELSRALFKAFLELEEEEFVGHFKAVARAIAASSHAVKVLDGRYMTLIHGLLRLVYLDESDKIIRQGVLLTTGFLGESDPLRKEETLVRDVGAFLDSLRDRRSEKAFSALILLQLKSCTLDEFRLVTVENLAARFGYHPGYLSQKFSKEQGCSLHKAILNEKFSRAMLLFMEQDHPSVKDVASCLGFSSSIYFSRLFRARFGMLPTDVRTRMHGVARDICFLSPSL